MCFVSEPSGQDKISKLLNAIFKPLRNQTYYT